MRYLREFLEAALNLVSDLVCAFLIGAGLVACVTIIAIVIHNWSNVP